MNQVRYVKDPRITPTDFKSTPRYPKSYTMIILFVLCAKATIIGVLSLDTPSKPLFTNVK